MSNQRRIFQTTNWEKNNEVLQNIDLSLLQVFCL